MDDCSWTCKNCKFVHIWVVNTPQELNLECTFENMTQNFPVPRRILTLDFKTDAKIRKTAAESDFCIPTRVSKAQEEALVL